MSPKSESVVSLLHDAEDRADLGSWADAVVCEVATLAALTTVVAERQGGVAVIYEAGASSLSARDVAHVFAFLPRATKLVVRYTPAERPAVREILELARAGVDARPSPRGCDPMARIRASIARGKNDRLATMRLLREVAHRAPPAHHFDLASLVGLQGVRQTLPQRLALAGLNCRGIRRRFADLSLGPKEMNGLCCAIEFVSYHVDAGMSVCEAALHAGFPDARALRKFVEYQTQESVAHWRSIGIDPLVERFAQAITRRPQS